MITILQVWVWTTLLLVCSFARRGHRGRQRDCLDVAVIGGGIGGTYTGYRLRNHNKRISIFEYSDRIGGRMFTAKLPNVDGTTVDFGAMRIKPKEHKSLVNIVNEVGLRIVDFPLNFGNRNETVYYLRGRHLKPDELGGPKMPYNLRPDERLRPDDLVWKLFTENTNTSRVRYPPEELEEEVYRVYTRHGVPLYTLTLDEFYGRYASREAYNYIREAGVWYDSVGGFGAHLALKYLAYPGAETSDLKTIDGGFSRLPNRLLSRFLRASRRHKLHLNHELVAMEGRPGDYNLRFASTGESSRVTRRNICAKKVVLAIQRDCVEKLNFPPFRNRYFRKQLNSVIDVPAQKIFLAYPYTWWKQGNEDITHARSNLASKFSYDWRTGTNGYEIHLPSYSDGPSNVAHWRRLQDQGSTISGSLPGDQRVTTAVRNTIHSYMSQIYRIPENQIPSTVGGGMQLWDRFPFKAAWHYYKPGFRMAQTRDYILKPFRNHEVFIVGNSWWPNALQSWSDSTLRMVELLIEKYFN